MKKYSLTILLFSAFTMMKAQDIHFSMFNYSPMTLNPANAGAEDEIRANLNFRNQWKTVASPFVTMAGSYDMKISGIGNGFLSGGLNFYNDKAGDSKMGITQANLSLAYHLKVADGQTIGLGLMTGYAQRSLTTSALTWGNQYDGMNYNSGILSTEPNQGNFTKSFLDLGTGIVYTFSTGERYSSANDFMSFNVGFSAMHVHTPNISFYGTEQDLLFRKFVFHANGLIGIPNSRISFNPGVMTAFQGGAREILFGSNVRIRIQEDSKYTGIITGASISFGAWYRNKDAVSLTTILQFGGYTLAFAYDVNTSSLKEASNGKGGFELALRFVYPNSSTHSRSGSTRFL